VETIISTGKSTVSLKNLFPSDFRQIPGYGQSLAFFHAVGFSGRCPHAPSPQLSPRPGHPGEWVLKRFKFDPTTPPYNNVAEPTIFVVIQAPHRDSAVRG